MSENTNNTLVWKVTKRGDNRSHYIMGTIHTATHEAMSFRDIAETCIDRVSLYAGEMDLNAVDESILSKHVMLSANQTLKDLFSEKKYLKYKKIIKKAYRIDLDDFIKYTPFYILNFIADHNLPRTQSMNLDYALWTYATLAGKEMHGLESFEEQCSIMNHIPLAYQIKAFKDNLRNISLNRKKVIKLNTLYAKGDLKQIYKSSKKSMGSIRNLMIYDRNAKMIDKCLELFSKQSCFIAVGAAHLPNAKGILSGLKRAGYQIKMIKSNTDV